MAYIKITAWVTKYALTSGAFKAEGEVCSRSGNIFSYRLPGCFSSAAHGNEWHQTRDEAIKDCERRRLAKIASLEKQLAKLRAMTIVVPK